MKIALIASDLPNDGIAEYSRKYQKALSETHSVDSFTPQSILENGLTTGYDIALVQYERSHYTFSQKNRYYDVLNLINCPIAVVMHEVYHTDPFKRPVPRVRSLLDAVGMLKKFKWHFDHPEVRFGRKLVRNNMGAQLVAVHSENERCTLIRQGMDGSRICVIPMPLPEFAPALPKQNTGITPGRKIVGTFGFLSAATDYQIMADLLDRDPSLAWLQVGGAQTGALLQEYAHLQERLEPFRHTGRFYRTGFVPEEELGAWLSVPDVFIFPLKFKSASASISYALAAGKPVIASDIPYCAEAARQYGCITLFKAGNPDSLHAVTEETLSQDSSHRDLTRLRLSNKFGFSKCSQKLVAQLEKII